MAETKPTSSGRNGDKIWGIPCTWISQFLAQVGIPGGFMFAMIYLIGWVIAPPIIQAHVKFVESTGKTMDKMADTMESIDESQQSVTESVTEIRRIEQRNDVFMGIVSEQHQMQLKKMDDMHVDVKDIKREVEK